jgi:glycine/serine hydroxymethyltransferase
MKEEQMRAIAGIIAAVVNEVKDYNLPEDKEARQKYLKKFYKDIKSNKTLKDCREKVLALCDEFPLYEGLKL